jgi:uncharacterized protein YyaL (SSP411 family)
MWRLALADYAPRSVTLRLRPGLRDVAPWTQAMPAAGAGGVAYVCEGHACRAPVTTTAALRAALAAPTTPGSRAPAP